MAPEVVWVEWCQLRTEMGAVVGFQSVIPLDRPVDFRLQPVRSWWSGEAGTTAVAIPSATPESCGRIDHSGGAPARVGPSASRSRGPLVVAIRHFDWSQRGRPERPKTPSRLSPARLDPYRAAIDAMLMFFVVPLGDEVNRKRMIPRDPAALCRALVASALVTTFSGLLVKLAGIRVTTVAGNDSRGLPVIRLVGSPCRSPVFV
ncbi:hypothetical protein RCH17_003789 [Arthrobacter sp. MP_M7]|nr:hypothetical protein [Arthrobacter sp. MP_M4]MEC5204957.1 hypothetical protein [Arthrobacter sp. MP_M7]